MKIVIVIISTLILLTSCSDKIDIEKEKAQILQMHNAQRDYHFEKDSIAFVNQLSDNHIAVKRGIISRPKRKEAISKYNAYFSLVEFVKWNDVTDPIIRISDDGKMAYTVVDKIVAVKYKDSIGNEVYGETHFAWTAVYVKNNDGWKIECATSTNKPIE